MSSSTTTGHRVLVTGAAGFVGSHVVEVLAGDPRTTVTATDAGGEERLAELGHLDTVASRWPTYVIQTRSARWLLASTSSCTSLQSGPKVRRAVRASRMRSTSGRRTTSWLQHVTPGAAASCSGRPTPSTAPSPMRIASPSRRTRPGCAPASTCTPPRSWPPRPTSSPSPLPAGPNTSRSAWATSTGRARVPGSNGALTTDLIRAVRSGETPRIPWAASAQHALIHVQDVAEAIRRAVFVEVSNIAINVVGRPRTSREIFGTLAELIGADPASIEWDERRTRHQLVSQVRMKDVLDFSPAFGLKDGLRSVIEWYDSTDCPSATT